LSSPVFFDAPHWLVGLIPWAGLVLYLLHGRARAITVPFLPLWQESSQEAERKRAWRFPPAAIAAALMSALLAVIAAAQPKIRWAGEPSNRPVIVIADRGITMSADHRLALLAGEASPLINKIIASASAQLIAVPAISPTPIDGSSFSSAVAALAPTAMDTKDALETAEHAALADPKALVIVLSDQAAVSDDRLVQISPETSYSNIEIARLAVRAAPAPQAMITLQNDSAQTQGTLRVSGAKPQMVQLPPHGKTADYFVDLTNAPATVEASVDSAAQAWAVRGAAWPRVVAQGAIPDELQRMIDVYQRHRTTGDESATITIVPIELNSVSDQSTVAIVPQTFATTSDNGAISVTPSQITSGIDWNSAARQVQVADIQPDSSWQKLVWTPRHVLVAQRNTPSRQVWVGIRPGTWAATPDFVVFWGKVFDWIGQGNDRYTSQPVGPLPADWKPVGFTVAPLDNGLVPGLYQNGKTTIALNAAAPRGPFVTSGDWRPKLAELASQQGIVWDAGPLVVLAALVFLIISARGLANMPDRTAALV
jgi:hypothetical protein